MQDDDNPRGSRFTKFNCTLSQIWSQELKPLATVLDVSVFKVLESIKLKLPSHRFLC